MIDLVRIPRFLELVGGYTEAAIRTKIERRIWREGREWFRAPDGHIFISIRGVDTWVRSGFVKKDGK